MARRKTRINWTPKLIAALRKQHADHPDLSQAACNRMFAQKYNMGFQAAKAAHYKYVVKNENPPSTTRMFQNMDALAEKLNMNSFVQNNYTLEEIINAQRWAASRGYVLTS